MAVETEKYRSNEAFGLEKPEFDCGRFTMVFSSDPKGFEVLVDKTLSRRDAESPLPLDPLQRNIVRTAIQNQFGYTTADQAKDALNAYRKDPNNQALKTIFTEKQKQYHDHISIVTGIRNVRRQKDKPNVLVMDTRPVNLPLSINLSKPEASPTLKEMVSSYASTTIVLETSDGKGILQHRSKDATSWPDTPAASASGYIDEVPFQGRLKKDKPTNLRRTLRKMTRKDVDDNVLREIDEEIGLDKNSVFDVRLGAMVHQRQSVHDEFIFSAKTKLTAKEVVETSAKAAKSKKLRPGEFREKFVIFDMTPENIKKLVTEVKCPIPDAHCSAFVNKGYELMLAKGSKEQAASWRAEVERLIPQNYKIIDEIVVKDLKAHPEKLTNFPQRLLTRIEANVKKFKDLNPNATAQQLAEERQRQINALPKRNPDGYSPDYTPSEQGLKGFKDALDETGFKYQITSTSV